MEITEAPVFSAASPIEAAYDKTVRDDIETFRRYALKFLAGEITDDQFRAQRLRRGIYGQRQPGVHMVRTKIPSGTLLASQLRQLARVADRLHIPVMAYGLRTDFQGKLFSGSRALLAIADELREVRTVCRCGRKATMVVRLGPDGKAAKHGEQVAIGKEAYVSLCRRHWEEEMGRTEPEDFVGFAVR